ncbi:MAG: porin family protein [Gammaproteobacteria bacterium]|nr:porin family protein [Gammaproteobacteria bacterium]MDH5692189.1 porin family protein [Gammaproteobacteria bacterium]
MKRIHIFLVSALLMVPAAQAQKFELGELYFLGKAGAYDIALNEADPLYVVGLSVGKEIYPDLSFEVDFDYGVEGGQYGPSDAQKNYEVWTLAGFAAYRMPLFHGFYLKGKAGLLHESVTDNSTKEVTDFSAGGGLGLVVPKLMDHRVTFELQYTQIEADIAATQLGVQVDF